MMTSRERVTAALTFSNPDRAPRDLWALPYVVLFRREEFDAVLDAYPTDISIAPQSQDRVDDDAQLTAQVGTYTDEWGSVWQVGEPGVIGEVKQPALPTWDNFTGYQPPWETIRGGDLSHVNRMCGETGKFVLSDAVARPFERLQFIRGTENTFIDLAYGTKELRQLLEMIHEYQLEDVRRWCQTDVDGIFMLDDWGSNQRLLIKPETWREVFKPLYQDYCDLIHAAGKFAFFHTDGHTEAIFGDLIEVGMNAINAQLFTMNIEELARKYRGKVTFWGEIDRQYVLPFGTAEEVGAAVMRVRSALDDGSGGVIAQCEWGKDNTRANIEAVYEAWMQPLPAAPG